ncbi:MAG: V-type ATP synthase subunit I [bacterium]
MSKVEIVGEKNLLRDVLSLLQEMGVFQLEPPGEEAAGEELKEFMRPLPADEKTAFERLFLEDLRKKIDEFFSHLPKLPVRKSYIEPRSIIGTISYTIEKHLAACRQLKKRRAEAKIKITELGRYIGFLDTIESLFKDSPVPPDFDVIGLTLKDQTAVERLKKVLSLLTDDKFKLLTVPAGDGTLTGLITVDKNVTEAVSRALTEEQVPEMSFPPSFSSLSLSGKIAYLEDKTSGLLSEIEGITTEMKNLCMRWAPLYQSVRDWIDERLTILRAAASVLQTRMCFFIHGWIPSHDIERLMRSLQNAFGERVVIEEKEFREQDLERIPSVIENPPYFKPFELFTRLLPLPAYSSYDPTPFIGIFFPLFFGIILGDAGYGLALAVIALILRKRFRHKEIVSAGAKILLVSSFYAIIFGILFGEFFGDLPSRLFGLEPLWVDRRTAIIPMLSFTIALGAMHILLGLVLGSITAFRKREKREAIAKLLHIAVILGLIAVLASFAGFFPVLLTRPIIMIILIIIPFLFFTGGILAPLELMKNIGNIISYVRIMAIGLTSVLLAFVANRLAGLTGNIAIGIMVASALHLLNIILGVFSPTIHSLRLHYVEFFSKFVEPGGRKFEPFKK